MKKLALLFALVLTLLFGTINVPPAFADSCNFTFNNGIQFCYGGFSSAQELRNTRVEYQCISNCSRNIFNNGQGTQTFDNANASITQDANGFYSCSGGGFDSSVIAVGGTITIQGRLVDKSTGGVQCSQNQAIKVDSTGKIVAAGGGAIPEGTVLQPGSALQFCGANNSGIQTALGCIPTDPSAFIGFVLSIGIGLAGGIAFLLILLGGFQIMTSTGNPEHLNAGKELVSSAIAGLLLIIFSVFILRIIGVTILGIPGFQ